MIDGKGLPILTGTTLNGWSASRRVYERLDDIAGDLDRILRKEAGKPMKFSLIVWNDDGASPNYISNQNDRSFICRGFELIMRRWREGSPENPMKAQ